MLKTGLCDSVSGSGCAFHTPKRNTFQCQSWTKQSLYFSLTDVKSTKEDESDRRRKKGIGKSRDWRPFCGRFHGAAPPLLYFFILLCSTLVFIARFYALSPGSLQHPAWVLRSKLVLDPGFKFSIHYNVRKTIKTSSLSCFELNQLWSDLFPVFIVLFWTNKKLKNQIQSWTRWKLHLFFEGNCHLMIELPQKVKRKIKTVMHWRLKLCY